MNFYGQETAVNTNKIMKLTLLNEEKKLSAMDFYLHSNLVKRHKTRYPSIFEVLRLLCCGLY